MKDSDLRDFIAKSRPYACGSGFGFQDGYNSALDALEEMLPSEVEKTESSLDDWMRFERLEAKRRYEYLKARLNG